MGKKRRVRVTINTDRRKKNRMKESIRRGRLNVKGRLNQFVLQKKIII